MIEEIFIIFIDLLIHLVISYLQLSIVAGLFAAFVVFAIQAFRWFFDIEFDNNIEDELENR